MSLSIRASRDYVGLPGYSGDMSPRSSRSPVMPDFDNRSTSGSPSQSGSESTSPCRSDDENEVSHGNRQDLNRRCWKRIVRCAEWTESAGTMSQNAHISESRLFPCI